MADEYFKTPDETNDPEKVNTALSSIKDSIKNVDDRLSEDSTPEFQGINITKKWRIRMNPDDNSMAFEYFEEDRWVEKGAFTK